ncbi:MAG: hypothetical protein V2I33_06750 [Kangiellaceae bacterium]|jgi:hypothetical protein|nr:hypothetical protein [Kangiellaceae bacterium]
MKITKYILISALVASLFGCSDAQDEKQATKPKSIKRLSEQEAETLITECFNQVQAAQDEFASQLRGKSELITRATNESYRKLVANKTTLSIEQRLKHFKKYKALNLSFSYWGSLKNSQGKFSRYVITRYCNTNGVEITGVRKLGLQRMAR